MIQPQDNAAFTATRRVPVARIHAVPTPKSSIARFVDAIESPVALADRDGRVVAMNGPARDCFIGRSGPLLRQAIESHVRAVISDRRHRIGDVMPNRAHTIDAGSERFVVTVVTAGSDLAAQDVGAMVLLRREAVENGEAVCSEAALAKRFGLTAQEARVAMMLAEHRRNREIADRLGVSVHTARHHTERVLAKLQVHSRHDVERVIG